MCSLTNQRHTGMSTRRIDPEISIINKCTSTIKLLNYQTAHFPNHEKFALTLQIRNTAYEILNLIVKCEKQHYNKTTLTELDIKHEQLRTMIKLAFDLHYYDFYKNKRTNNTKNAIRKYTAISILINELGAMIGAWLTMVRSKCK